MHADWRVESRKHLENTEWWAIATDDELTDAQLWEVGYKGRGPYTGRVLGPYGSAAGRLAGGRRPVVPEAGAPTAAGLTQTEAAERLGVIRFQGGADE
jgi:hypothetical protein